MDEMPKFYYTLQAITLSLAIVFMSLISVGFVLYGIALIIITIKSYL